MAAVRASGLIKRFGTVLALDRVDLDVAEGEVHGLLGPNGAGKTTLLRMLFGLLRADEGSIELFGRALDPPREFPLEGVAGFAEAPGFYPYLSGRANLELLAELDGTGSKGAIDGVLDTVGLKGRGGDRVGGYSTGMRQRLGIAAALLRTPRLVLLDEPTSGIDPAGSRAVIELVRELREQGVALLLSSHQIGEIEPVCDRFTVLRGGQVVWSGVTSELRAQAPNPRHRLRTSDDRRAAELAPAHGIALEGGEGGGLIIAAAEQQLDRYVVALGKAEVAVRSLELLAGSLERLYGTLTREPSPTGPAPVGDSPPGDPPVAEGGDQPVRRTPSSVW